MTGKNETRILTDYDKKGSKEGKKEATAPWKRKVLFRREESI